MSAANDGGIVSAAAVCCERSRVRFLPVSPENYNPSPASRELPLHKGAIKMSVLDRK